MKRIKTVRRQKFYLKFQAQQLASASALANLDPFTAASLLATLDPQSQLQLQVLVRIILSLALKTYYFRGIPRYFPTS